MQKKYSTMKKLTALLVCICITAAFLLSAWFIASHADHDCPGQDCPTCAQIQYCANIFQKLGAGLDAFVPSAWLLAAVLLCSLLAVKFPDRAQDTPVKLKVRLNN